MCVKLTSEKPKGSYLAPLIRRYIEVYGTAPDTMQNVQFQGILTSFDQLSRRPWCKSSVSNRLGLPVMGCTAPWSTNPIKYRSNGVIVVSDPYPNIAMQLLFCHDDPKDLTTFGKRVVDALNRGDLLFACQDGKHLHQTQLSTLAHFLSWGPLYDFGLVNKPEHTREETEPILKMATLEEYEAFFHEYRNREIGRDGLIPDWKEVDAPF